MAQVEVWTPGGVKQFGSVRAAWDWSLGGGIRLDEVVVDGQPRALDAYLDLMGITRPKQTEPKARSRKNKQNGGSMTIIESPPSSTTTTVAVSAGAFKNLLKKVGPFRDARSIIPVLRDVRLTAKNGMSTVTATTLDTTIVTPFEYSPAGPVDMVLPYASLKKFIDGRSARDLITIESVAGGTPVVKVTAGTTTVALEARTVDEWPTMATAATSAPVEFDIAAVAEVAVAAKTSDERPILQGVFIEGDRVVATDSYRLHIVDKLPTPWPYDAVLVPAAAAVGAARLGATTLAPTGNGVVYGCPDGTRIYSRAIGSEFPKYRGLIPGHGSANTTLAATDPAAVVKAISEFKWLDGYNAPVTVNLDDGVTLSMSVKDVGEATADAHLIRTGVALSPKVAFNPNYLGALFTGIDTDDHAVLFQGIDALKPWVLTASRKAGGEYLRLLMPVRVS